MNELVVFLDREQGGQQRLRTSRIEPHVLFKISDAMTWLHKVGLIEDKMYGLLVKYLEEKSQLGTASS